MKSIVRFISALFIFVCCGSAPLPEAEKAALPAPISQAPETSWSKEDLLGKFDPAVHEGFSKVDKIHTTKDNIYLRKEAYQAFRDMSSAAKADGIHLIILSATRNFDYQRSIWEKKWKREKYKGWKEADIVRDILKYSSMPGTSRHHWGTDMDFNSVEPAYFNQGDGKKTYDWLLAHAGEYGFCQTYTRKDGTRTGYEEEKWHWTYLPLSGQMLNAYNRQISYDDISGFSGSSSAKEARVIEDYVNGIAPACNREAGK